MDIKERILDIAQRLIQERGVNGFSYADIAKEVGVSKASLHHHFATKSDLVLRLLERYTQSLKEHLNSVAAKPGSTVDKLQAFSDLYAHSYSDGRVCVGGILSAEAITLDEALMPPLREFFDCQQQWLVAVITDGQTRGELTLEGTPESHACGFMAGLQGALMVARSAPDDHFFNRAVQGLMGQFA